MMLMNRLSCRNTKALVSQEMLLPPQTKYLCETSLTALEQQNFRDLLEISFEDLGLTDKGKPRRGSWLDIEIGHLQMWLTRLRQA